MFVFLFICSILFYKWFIFNDLTMHKIYEDEGIFNFIYSIPQMIYSSVISTIINSIIRTLSLTANTLLKIKNEKKEK